MLLYCGYLNYSNEPIKLQVQIWNTSNSIQMKDEINVNCDEEINDEYMKFEENLKF